MSATRFSSLFMAVAQESGGIEGLLKAFFEFLYNKTDFYYECDPGDSRGFPPGLSRQMVLEYFTYFQQEHYKRFPQKSLEDYEKKRAQWDAKEKLKKEQLAKKAEQQKAKLAQKAITQQSAGTVTAPSATVEPKKPEFSAQSLLSTRNGSKTDKYTWNQDGKEVEVCIKIALGTSAKQLNVSLQTDRIEIIDKTNGTIIIKGELHQKINTADSVWRIEEVKKQLFLTLNLEKASEKIWSTVFKGDQQIDTSKVDNSKSMYDYDQETQSGIRKAMYEQELKRKGLPTSEDQKTINLLHKMWDTPESPFKGQPFDPTRFNLPNAPPTE